MTRSSIFLHNIFLQRLSQHADSSSMSSHAEEEDYEEVPLVSRRYFGAGLKRKRVEFVPSSSHEAATRSLPATPSASAADRYLSIVFNKSTPGSERSASAPPKEGESNTPVDEGGRIGPSEDPPSGRKQPTCEICHRAITDQDSSAVHESSIAHQICLQHSHPPSHLDRARKGLAVLENHGWDPDSRKGLGAQGAGILYPIKAKENPQKAGLGLDLRKQPARVEKAATLDAGKVRLQEREGKKKAAKLREAFYRNDDMEKYLGAEGEMNANLDLAAFKRARRR
ncbi:uncharacterized protein LTR77_009019 [Saxophila tyrrhenica]|uniref:G-patch domain-containing protein n=1 Tax=Saxophila tyrrhenica TaxID=1690608 RepID=A0AAV9NZP0_9PEZI|nr:hypothetical protein LTR77_009019 [Saxophila tyrrhenica]